MKKIFTLENENQLNILFSEKGSGIEEVILAPKELSRLGTLDIKSVNTLASKLKQHGKKVFLQWDILMTENLFDSTLRTLELVDWASFDAIRVQDAGAFQYALTTLELSVQLILEQGNHNVAGLSYWIEHAKKISNAKLERVILSLEIPYERLLGFVDLLKENSIEIELLALGKILLFYTPRSLVKPLFNEFDETESIEVLGNSEESPHKGFPILENRHGTFMFNTKDHCIVEYFEKLQEIKLDAWRFDLSSIKEEEKEVWLELISKANDSESFLGLKEKYPEKLIQGFFKTNKSDVLFKKLKNKRISRKDTGFLGEVVDVKKKGHIGIHLKNPAISFELGQTLTFFTPEGKEKDSTVSKAWRANGEDLTEAKYGQVIFIPHLGGISPKTMVYDKSQMTL